jgi:hypothetical protein
VAGDGGFDSDCIAGFDVLYLFADRFYNRGAFVPDDIGILDDF